MHPPLPAIFERDLLDYLSKPPVPEVEAKQELKVVPHGWLDYDWREDVPEAFKVCNYSIDDDGGDLKENPNLFEHPFVSRRFIITPIMSEMSLDDGKINLERVVTNPFGITVYDVYISLARM